MSSKSYMIVILLLLSNSLKAQMAGGNTNQSNEYKTTFFETELGLGSWQHANGTTFNIGFNWMHTMNNYMDWDMIGLKLTTNTTDIGNCLIYQAMTGIHLMTPNIGQSISDNNNLYGYSNLRIGYGYYGDENTGGICYEIGLGIKFSKHLSIGYVYNNQHIEDCNIKYNGIQLGVTF